MKSLKKYSKIAINTYTSLYASVTSLIFAKLYFNAMWRFTKESAIIFEKMHQRVFFHLFALATSLFVPIMIYYYFDNLDLYNKKDYLEKKSKRLLIARPEYLTGFVISLLFAVSMLTSPIHSLLSIFGNVSVIWSNILSIVTLALVRLIQLYNLQVKWEDEINHPLFVEQPIFKSSQDIKNFKPIYLFLKPLGFLALFAVCYLLAARYYIEIVYSLYVILTSLWQGILLIALPQKPGRGHKKCRGGHKHQGLHTLAGFPDKTQPGAQSEENRPYDV